MCICIYVPILIKYTYIHNIYTWKYVRHEFLISLSKFLKFLKILASYVKWNRMKKRLIFFSLVLILEFHNRFSEAF